MVMANTNSSFDPSKKQVNRRLRRLTGLKRKKVNRLRKIEKGHRKKINKKLGMFPGEEKLGKMNMDRAESSMRSKINKFGF